MTELQLHAVGLRDSFDPAGLQHPGVEHRADHRAARDEQLELLVGKLPVTGHQRPAVVVAGHHRAVKQLERLEETGVRHVRQIENHSQPLELLEQLVRPFGVSGPLSPVPTE